jgi:hypothetical protein
MNLAKQRSRRNRSNVITRKASGAKKLGGKIVRGAQKQFDKAFYAYADSVKDSKYLKPKAEST